MSGFDQFDGLVRKRCTVDFYTPSFGAISEFDMSACFRRGARNYGFNKGIKPFVAMRFFCAKAAQLLISAVPKSLQPQLGYILLSSASGQLPIFSPLPSSVDETASLAGWGEMHPAVQLRRIPQEPNVEFP